MNALPPRTARALRIDAALVRLAPTIALLMSAVAEAHTGFIPPSLKTINVPEVPGLLDGVRPIVVDKEKAIALGKALFWDMNVGSDGMACGSCHFHAGVDIRTKNQISPGKTHLPAHFNDSNRFDPNDPRGPAPANYQLSKGDFPLYSFDPVTGKLDESRYTHNVVASSGTFSGEFTSVAASGRLGTASTGSVKDDCKPYTGSGAGLDQTFNVGGIHTRRVEPRNTPTFVNSVLFDRLFWDGRANNTFNGVSGWGPRDPNAFIWVADGKSVWKTRLALQNSAMASLAVGPPLNEFEMSCKGRTWPDIGRKLLKRRPLEAQDVHPDDSVLGTYRDSSGRGMAMTYEDLVKQAFAPRFWQAGDQAVFGKPGYDGRNFTQAEVNFSLFFGLAIQLYAGTQISDDTPFDRSNLSQQNGRFVDANSVLTDQQLQGFSAFNDAHCIFCHSGPLFSGATNRTTYFTNESETRTMVQRIATTDGRLRMVDTGFLNNGAVPSENDPGIDGLDDFGNPLSLAPQYLASLAGRQSEIKEPLPFVQACEIGFNNSNFFSAGDFGGSVQADPAGNANCSDPAFAVVPNPDLVAAALDRGKDERVLGPTGAQFKLPALYNITLTGPYMHNGGMSTLDQVLDHYLIHSGNFNSTHGGQHANPDMHSGLIFSFDDSRATRDALIAFLEALTDERVRNEKAPFDHPQLLIPNGHPGNQLQTEGAPATPDMASDDILVVPAVGRDGRSTPLAPFHTLLPD